MDDDHATQDPVAGGVESTVGQEEFALGHSLGGGDVAEITEVSDGGVETTVRHTIGIEVGAGRFASVREVAILVDVETVFAMTVHKSQGSEFEHAVLVLPEARNPVLTKELVYTAITRASKHFSLLESRPGVLEAAVQTPVRRISGLDLSAAAN